MVQPTWTFRSGRRQDWRALRMLLPQAVYHGSKVATVVVADEGGLIVGAAAISPRLRTLPLRGPRCALHVIPPARGKGLGRELADTAAHIARRLGARAMYAWDMHEAQSPAITMWSKLGFTKTVRVEEGCNDVARTVEYLATIYQGVLQRGWIPSNARIIPLSQADPRQIARLHVDHLGGIYDEILHTLHGNTPLKYDPRLSPVILVDEEVIAFTLCERIGPDSAFVHATAVHTSFRNGWANVWLKYNGVCGCLDLGVKALLYHTYDQHRDTRRVNRATGGTTRVLLEPYRILVEDTE
jgi:GNAT superfamily N-acetyltransferase